MKCKLELSKAHKQLNYQLWKSNWKECNTNSHFTKENKGYRLPNHKLSSLQWRNKQK